MSLNVHDTTQCRLGEGAFWHPLRDQFFWVDILAKRLLSRHGDKLHIWQFDRHISAVGWVDRDQVLVATDCDLCLLNLATDQRDSIIPLEADRPETRSNDGRADPYGGFWIGTMGFDPARDRGAIYRFYQGDLRVLVPDIAIPNAICFSPSGQVAYFADTPQRIIHRLALDDTGWPSGDPVPWIDLRDQNLNPDGAVCDAEGNLWNAQWGAGQVACYSPDGDLIQTVQLPAKQTTCPAFGGAQLDTLFVTSATESLPPDELAATPTNGQTFSTQTAVRGQPEHRILL